MISFLDYIKEISSNPWGHSGVIFSGNSYTTVANRFPKYNNQVYLTPTLYDITDMAEYGLVGFWKYVGGEEEVVISNKPYYKCELYMPDSEEPVGYYYIEIPALGSYNSTNSKDKMEIDNVVYDKDGYNFKQGNTINYIMCYLPMIGTETFISSGAPVETFEALKKEQGKYLVFRQVQMFQNTSTMKNYTVAYIDMDNRKVIWNPTKNGGIWEDFKYVPGTNGKAISRTGSYEVASSDYIIYINMEDDDYCPAQLAPSGSSTQPIFIADYQSYINTETEKQTEKHIIDVPNKLLEKYGTDYRVQLVKFYISSETIMDALVFQFAKLEQDNAYRRTTVIYHPSTKNWCEIDSRIHNNAESQLLVLADLLTSADNYELNFIDQSVIDLDIYKKMADIGNGLMLFDDETEDLKYLYDTKNKELYNEYCDLVGTNAITFKK